MNEKPQIVMVNRAIIQSGESILLLQRSASDRNNPNMWEFPGGKLDAGETLIESLAREVYEETGLNIDQESQLVYVEDERLTEGPYKGYLYVALFHAVRFLSGELELSSEHDAFVWEYPEQGLDRNLTPTSRHALEQFI